MQLRRSSLSVMFYSLLLTACDLLSGITCSSVPLSADMCLVISPLCTFRGATSWTDALSLIFVSFCMPPPPALALLVYLLLLVMLPSMGTHVVLTSPLTSELDLVSSSQTLFFGRFTPFNLFGNYESSTIGISCWYLVASLLYAPPWTELYAVILSTITSIYQGNVIDGWSSFNLFIVLYISIISTFIYRRGAIINGHSRNIHIVVKGTTVSIHSRGFNVASDDQIHGSFSPTAFVSILCCSVFSFGNWHINHTVFVSASTPLATINVLVGGPGFVCHRFPVGFFFCLDFLVK